ncbi:sodium-coupled monocarboxylate transporter 2 [Dermacentor silvarum]|uniref:sodium-coupled monocarboxylate transporter 2 n=1 Tax=Dermacentor silvarum TaxID=543639 RepID=UPI0018972309|nr:sodium-coupled monocarboxylate transporter 2 [Dermacentor silvarum]
MTMVTEYVVFGILMAFNLGLGVYFSRRRIEHSGTAEVFLGSRSLRSLPLAVSMVATMLSSTGLVGFTGHFYAYGFHQAWNDVAIIVVAPLVAHLFLPVLYELRITSVFQVRFTFLAEIATGPLLRLGLIPDILLPGSDLEKR